MTKFDPEILRSDFLSKNLDFEMNSRVSFRSNTVTEAKNKKLTFSSKADLQRKRYHPIQLNFALKFSEEGFRSKT